MPQKTQEHKDNQSILLWFKEWKVYVLLDMHNIIIKQETKQYFQLSISYVLMIGV